MFRQMSFIWQILTLGNLKGGIYKTSNSAASWSLAGSNSEIMYTVAVNQNNHNQVFAGTLANSASTAAIMAEVIGH